jgi:hypothetical protein
MSADFELIARRLVDVRRAQDVVALDLGRQRHRTTNHGAERLAVSTISSADWSISL